MGTDTVPSNQVIFSWGINLPSFCKNLGSPTGLSSKKIDFVTIQEYYGKMTNDKQNKSFQKTHKK